MIPQQDFFDINPITEEETLEQKFTKERSVWKETISDMSQQMKNLLKVSELMVEIYSKRQICLEYYHYLISILIKINKEYRKQYAERHEYWSFKSSIRYPNESSKNNKIQTELADILEKREMVDNHAKFIDKTVSTIDNLIYAIPKRIEIEQISRGK